MNPKEIVAKNLQYFLDRKGVTQTQMAEHLGYPEMTVSNWMKAKTYPRVDKMQEMADYFNVRRSDIEEEKEDRPNFTSTSYYYIPESISAGLPINMDGMTEADTISIPDALMGKHAGQTDLVISRINGDSMNKVVEDNSLIAVKPIELENLKNGDMVVFSDNYEYSVKYFYKRNDKLIFRPHSTNPDHFDQIYGLNDNIKINGKVVWYVTELS